MKTLFGAAAAFLVGAALWQTAQAQVAPPSSRAIISDVPGATNPPSPPPYPPPEQARPPAPPEIGYGASSPRGYRPTTPQTLDFGNSQPSEENYR
jgi:hypothetical protein